MQRLGTVFVPNRCSFSVNDMRKTLLMGLFMGLLAIANAQNRKLPAVDIKDLQGGVFNTGDIKNDGPTIVSFWATWCKPCVLELNTIAEDYIDWQEETGVKLVAISIDDARNTAKVAPYVNGQAWDYDVYLDANGDFKRAMNVNLIPYTFLLDKEGNIVWEHNSYAPGDEVELYEQVKKLSGH